MGIYRPDLILSTMDREMLLLLARLVLASDDQARRNVGRDVVPLSPKEAQHLLDLLEQFANSKLFIEGAYFSEELANNNGWTNDRLKEIYFSWRSRRGKVNISSGERWHEFTVRAGFNASMNAWIWPRDIKREPVRPMTLEYFATMERKLANEAGLHPRVRELMIKFIEQALPKLDDIRERRAKVRSGSIRRTVTAITEELSDHVGGKEKAPMTRRKLIALSTIVMDTGAYFATRDWTAAGVLSTLAAVTPDALDYGPKE